MATDASERKLTKSGQVGVPPPEPERLPCPRCDSTNTKFCYYNNYNFSQPRHFCKTCRRYWTRGGTLRDIPVGGGSRKNAKRPRVTLSSATTNANGAATVFSSPHHHGFLNFPAAASQFLLPFAADHGGAVPFMGDAKMCGSFASMFSTQGRTELSALGGFGFGAGLGPDEMDPGFGTAVWPCPAIVESRPPSDGSGVGGHTWHLENGESGGDCFALPSLAISTPGNFMK